MSEYIFEEGMKVVFSPKQKRLVEMMESLNGIGEGPFAVTNIVTVGECTCNKSTDFPDDHEYDCPTHWNIDEVGHSQLVTIDSPIGSMQFSGLFFIPA